MPGGPPSSIPWVSWRLPGAECFRASRRPSVRAASAAMPGTPGVRFVRGSVRRQAELSPAVLRCADKACAPSGRPGTSSSRHHR